MMMVGHEARCVQNHPRLLHGQGEAVREDVRRFGARPEPEGALIASARNEIGRAGNDASRWGHGLLRDNYAGDVPRRDPSNFASIRSHRWRPATTGGVHEQGAARQRGAARLTFPQRHPDSTPNEAACASTQKRTSKPPSSEPTKTNRVNHQNEPG